MKILIPGPTGNIGSSLISQFILKKQNSNVIVGARNIAKTKALFGNKVEYVYFNFSDPKTYNIFNNIDKLFYLSPPKNSEPVETTKKILAICKKAKIMHITFLSGRTTGDIEGYTLNTLEKLIITSSIKYTILRPGWFMQNFLSWWKDEIKNENKIQIPVNSGLMSFVDIFDIGEIAFLSLTENKPYFKNKTIEISGPSALSINEIALIFSNVLERKIKYVNTDEKEYKRKLIDTENWDEQSANFMIDLFRIVRSGKESKINLENQQILNRKLRTLKNFIETEQSNWQ